MRSPSHSLSVLIAVALSLAAAGATAFAKPAADPPLPTLTEPAQAQAPSVYRARREALMKQMGDGVAVVFAGGSADGRRISSGLRLLSI